MKLRLPDSYHNLISYIGTVISTVSMAMFVFLYVLASISTTEKAYQGLIIFIILPLFLALGLLLIPIGMIIKVRRRRRTLKKGISFGVIDFRIRKNRNAAIIFSIGTLLFLFLAALASYKGYHFTESVLFCGTLCHTVMKPEYTAYQTSPHARVSCAECHIGPGASWYIKSKLSGLYQVYATITNSYPRPIPTPIKSLRPVRRTCEECHWPQKVYGKQQILEIHYLTDKDNTRWDIGMLLNTGAGNAAFAFETGIHWHINQDIRIEYIHTDKEMLEIARVILINKKTNARIVFNDKAQNVRDEELKKYPPRNIDCMDCHNRPSHIYRDPLIFINTAIASKKIDAALPFIKKVASEACFASYPSMAQAMKGIDQKVRKYYSDNYPDILKQQPERVARSIAEIQDAFAQNIFPDMKVSWEAYPNHIGHLTTKGCFRCHDGQHQSDSGQVIRNDCNLCHIIYGQGPLDRMNFAPLNSSLEFKHPEDIGGAWKEMPCSDCHSTKPF